jgi:hypothetical protein
MFIYLWLCVTASFMPHGDRVMTYMNAAIEDYFDTVMDDQPKYGQLPLDRVG